jgi:DNA polymerase (family 10)
MTKEEIAGVLEQIATLLELKGENPFKIRAYANAPRATQRPPPRVLRELLNLSNDGQRWSGGQIMDKILFQLVEQNQKGQKSRQDGRAYLES